MLPRPDDVVQLIAGALGVSHLPVTDQLVILGQLVGLDAELEQADGRVDLLLDRALEAEVTDEGDADAPVVVVVRVRPGHVPAPAHVDVAVAAHEEVVAHVDPALGLDVERLDDPDVQQALGLVVAGLGGRVADYGVGGRLDLESAGRVRGGLGAPLRARYQPDVPGLLRELVGHWTCVGVWFSYGGIKESLTNSWLELRCCW